MRPRPTRLTVLAALLAAVIAFVAIGHAGSHLDSSFAESGLDCGICADPAIDTAAADEISHELLVVADVSLRASAGACRPAELAHTPRGPPALLA